MSTEPTPAPRPGRRHARRRLLDAPHLPVALYLAYIGGATAVTGPTRGMADLPGWLTHSWSAALVVGALLVVYGVGTGRTRVESVGHAAHLFGIGFYALVNAALLDGSNVVSVLVLAAVAAVRMRVLTRARAAQREAGRMLGGQR